MMMTIWKYKLTVADTQYITLPLGAEFLSVQTQDKDVCVWVLFDRSEARREKRAVHIVGTGNIIPDEMITDRRFLGTVQAGPFVWHVFVSRGQ